jgi:hypothetical protein
MRRAGIFTDISLAMLLLASCSATVSERHSTPVGVQALSQETTGTRERGTQRRASLVRTLPVAFLPGQRFGADASDFFVRTPDYSATLNGTGAVFSVRGSASEAATVRMELLGTRREAEPVPLGEASARFSSFAGKDPARWLRDVPVLSAVKYPAVYPGIDLVYHGTGADLTFDLVVAPSASAEPIALRFEGARSLEIDGEGDLVLAASGRTLRLSAPGVYQERDGSRQRVNGRYEIVGSENVRLHLGPYDRSLPLVIDPSFSFVQVVGGTKADEAFAIAVDGEGSIYVAGRTDSPDFPVDGALQPTLRYQDAFVLKLDPTGRSLVYATYLGGSNDEVAFGIAVDDTGAAYVAGQTASPDFPTTTNAFQADCTSSTPYGNCSTAFLVKLSSDGSALEYSTYLFGGFNENSQTAGFEEAKAVAVDAEGNAYVTGSTGSSHFPTTEGAFQPESAGAGDGFVVKLNPRASGADSLVYSTYLGGSWNPATGSQGGENLLGIAVDKEGCAYVTGQTSSADFPTKNAPRPNYGDFGDAFVTKLNADGSGLVYSTFLGGNNTDTGTAIAVDATGAAYVTGQTKSTDFPLRNEIQQATDWTSTSGDAFVTKLAPNGSDLVYSTYLGGGGFDYGVGIAVNEAGQAHVTGLSSSGDFPTIRPLPTSDSPDLAFVTKLDASGTKLIYSSRIKGWFEAGGAIAVDRWGNACVAGPIGMPSTSIDALVFKIVCSGDCNENGTVSVGELIAGVNIALGQLDAEDCLSFDQNLDGIVAVNELILGITQALEGCP